MNGMNQMMKVLEMGVFILYCMIPISLILAFIAQDGDIFMKTVMSFTLVYFAYGIMLQVEKEEKV